MLSPEIWNFKSPLYTFSSVSDTGLSEYKKTCEVIGNHHFNHNVTIILPETVLVPEDLNSALVEDSVYYKVDKLSLNTFLDKQFIDSFVKSGSLTGLSVGAQLDTDDTAAVTPCGHLVLNLQKETYQSLGLEGTQSNFSTQRYVVQINLKNPSFTPGKKNYERAVKCLTDFADLQMDFLISWEPPDNLVGGQLVCPSSVAAYFARLGYPVTACTPRTESCRRYGAQMPPLDSTPHQELLEWLGAVALGVDTSQEDPQSSYLSVYTGPQEDTKETQVAVLKYFGFFTPFQIKKLFNTFSAYVEARKDLPWGCLHVQGFADSPVSWGLQEHTFHTNGDNFYTVLMRPDLTLRLFRAHTFSSKMKLK